MTEGEENIIIKGVLLEAISRDFSEELSNNKEVSVSPRFKRQMMAMMNNPNKWAERHKRDYRRRFVKVVATIVYGTSETLTASQFKVSNKSADILARIFCGHYERPGVPKISERVANAKKWYNFL